MALFWPVVSDILYLPRKTSVMETKDPDTWRRKWIDNIAFETAFKKDLLHHYLTVYEVLYFLVWNGRGYKHAVKPVCLVLRILKEWELLLRDDETTLQKGCDSLKLTLLGGKMEARAEVSSSLPMLGTTSLPNWKWFLFQDSFLFIVLNLHFCGKPFSPLLPPANFGELLLFLIHHPLNS